MICEPRPSNENLRRDEAARRAATVRTHEYEVHVDFSDAQEPGVASYPVITTVRFDALDTDETFLDYLGASVEGVELNGVALDPEDVLDGARLRLAPLAATNTVTVRSHSAYSRSGEGVHRFVDPADGATYLYSQNEPADCRRIYPCFEQPDLKARFSVRITAPEAWHVASNGALEQTLPVGDGAATRVFATTEPMSTYITAFLAGPYAVWSDHYDGTTASGVSVSIPLNITTRASLAEAMDPEEVFEITKQGLDWFHEHFDSPYPWGKYDQAFVPEYNLGAMENPGLVTFTERHVFTSHATEAQHEGRANTILHEMCHMWFGDLVTMRWWDDLWLKESFADYVGTLATDEATRFTTAWTTFASKRKAWAYRQDQYPTTHPIVADITDLEAADQNFDGITYAKGASVLKQLSAFVGRDTFLAAARAYFRDHAFGNTSLDDFLAALAEASGRDMGAWADAWLRTAGVSRLRLEPTTQDGRITGLDLVQDGTDPRTGAPVSRPHVVRVGAFTPSGTDEPARRTAGVEVRLEKDRVAVPDLVGTDASMALLPNDEDLTYAKLGLDPHTLELVLGAGLDDELARATALAAAWNLARDGELPVERFVDGVVTASDLIEDSGVLAQVFAQAGSGLAAYTPAATRQELTARWVTFLLEAVLADPTPGDERTVRLRALFTALGRWREPVPEVLDVVAAWVDDAEFGLGEDLTWSARTALAAHARLGEEELRAAHAAAPTAVSGVGLRRALAARPLPEVKAAAWAAAFSGTDTDGAVLSNDHLQATIDGYLVDPTGAAREDEQQYWSRLRSLWREQTQGQATRVVAGLFPDDADLTDGDAETHPKVRAAQAWLQAEADAPAALRRLVVEGLDDLRRRLTAQAA